MHKANSVLSTAEPVQCISGSGSADLSEVLLVDSSNSNDCVAADGSAMLVSDSFRSKPTTTAGTELRAATVSSTTAAARADPDPPDTLLENARVTGLQCDKRVLLVYCKLDFLNR